MSRRTGGDATDIEPAPASAVRRASSWHSRPPRFANTRVELFVDEATPGADLHAGIIRLAPGARIPNHWHDVGELQYVLSGSGRFHDEGGASVPVLTGDAIYCAPGAAAAHGFTNDGEVELVILFAYPSRDGSGPALHALEEVEARGDT